MEQLIKPSLLTYGTKLKWNPEPFVAIINSHGISKHPDPNNPKMKVYLAVEIPWVQFFRHADYLAGANHQQFIDIMYKWVTDSIYLVSDGRDDEIYCIASSNVFKSPMIFGKLTKDNEVYKSCLGAFVCFSVNISFPIFAN